MISVLGLNEEHACLFASVYDKTSATFCLSPFYLFPVELPSHRKSHQNVLFFRPLSTLLRINILWRLDGQRSSSWNRNLVSYIFIYFISLVRGSAEKRAEIKRPILHLQYISQPLIEHSRWNQVKFKIKSYQQCYYSVSLDKYKHLQLIKYPTI